MNFKDTEKKLVGQPIFKQLLEFIPRNKFDMVAIKHKSDRYYKTFDSKKSLSLRKVTYRDDKKCIYEFISNSVEESI